MRLHVGERLEGAGPLHQPGGYIVTSVVRETSWYGLYAAKKIFYNFDFSAKRVRETDEVEWLDVFLRTNRYPILDDPAYVQQRRALARAEVRSVLGNRHSNLWPEPLDLLEIENTRDPFAFSTDGARTAEPIVVYARPSGLFLPQWQKQIVPISSIFSVLAELLEFMRQAHAENLLLLGLGPPSLIIDASDRVHYVGAEMALSRQSTLLKETTPTALWQRLYPADRFARGHAAPECFDPNQRPDARADLYAWGALAYTLFTGVDLGQLAQEQGRPWVTLAETHFVPLQKYLVQLPANNLRGWAEQAGIDPDRLLQDWPQKFLTAFRLLLSVDPGRRPCSVAELLAWLADPPPPPLAGLIALHTDADTAKLLLDCTGVDMDLEMTIQCGKSAPPRLPDEGATIAQGPLRPVIGLHNLPVTAEPIFYTAFTRRRNGDGAAYSPGVSAQLWQPDGRNLRQWVESEASAAFDAEQTPTRVGMVLGALDAGAVADSLLASTLPRVRAWGLRRAEQSARTQGWSAGTEALLWRFLSDPNLERRQAAAITLWHSHPTASDEVLLRILEALETPPIDAPVPLGHFLRQLQISEQRVHIVLQQFETRRPTTCPICRKPLTLGERGAHLQAEHGYVQYHGDLLPAEAVLARLWERTLQWQDRRAHEELVGMYMNLPGVQNNQDGAVERYLADLQSLYLGDPASEDRARRIPLALPYEAIIAFQAILRGSRLFLPIVRRLLRSPERRLRELSMQTILPYVQEELRLRPTAEDLRRLLKSLSSDLDQTDLLIDLCKQLAETGADQTIVNSCVAELQEERLVICPECAAEVRSKDLEFHLRRAHQVFQFRGVRHTYVDTRDTILKAVCRPPADLAAWKSLSSLAEEKHPGEADRYMVVWLYQFMKGLGTEERGTAVATVAEVLVGAGAAVRFLPLFAGPGKNASWELLGQRFALELCVALPALDAADVVARVAPILDHKELPRRLRENAALALLRSTGNATALATELLRAYVSNTSKKRGVEKLQNLEQRFGHSPAIDTVVKELDDEIRMSCPRCPAELRKKEMVGHLWDKHHLVLDGQRVREPWRVIEDWVVDYGLEKEPQVLQRCRELALKDDPQAGLARLQRLLYQRGLRDRELLNELRMQVKARKASLCPHCCAPVPIVNPPIVQPITLEPTRLTGYGCLLMVSESGLAPSLRIESPDAILYRGREPGRWLTRWGGVFLMLPPMLVGAHYLLDQFVEHGLPGSLLWFAAVGVALLVSGILFLIWPNPRPAGERLVKAAWQRLVPEMLQENLGPREWSFLHGLVEISERVGNPSVNLDVLLECCEEASNAAGADDLARACLARLSRLCLAEMRDSHVDPFDFVLTLAGECFKGKLPLLFLSELLENFTGKQRGNWKKSELNRLTIQLAEAAFNADVSIDDWFNLGRAYPVVSAVLNLEQRWHWVQFFALWVQRNHKPWDAVGQALTVFELVQSPAEYDDILAYYPDVLLYISKANLVLGTRGAWIEGVCVTAFPAGAELSVQRISGAHELSIGAVKIRCADNPRPHLDDIKRWLRWYFNEFLPTVVNLARPLLESRHRMWQLGKVACPDCGRPLVPCLGDLGVALK
jgi:uncharacterized C2H2 Zn-finger protein